MLLISRRVGQERPERIHCYINYNECRALCDLVEELGGSPRLLDTIHDRISIELVEHRMWNGREETVVGIKAPMHVEILRSELDQ